MKIDATHGRWCVASVLAVAAGALGYWAYATTTPGGPKGDTWIGLGFGVVATVLILFAAFLGARKRTLLIRMGSLTWWMRGHLWLGLLSLPMVLFHGAFAFGGPLTTTLLILLIVVVVSGLFGAIFQHVLPELMTAQVSREAPYEQIERLGLNRRRDAFELVSAACGELHGPAAASEAEALTEALGVPPTPPKKTPATVEGQDELRRFYFNTVLPYLARPTNGTSPLARELSATLVFDEVRPQLSPALHDTVDDLASMCREAQQHVRQSQLHRWLHGWLILHVPLSIALLVLMFVHMVMALYY